MISQSTADFSTVVSVLPLKLQEAKPGLIPGMYTLEACMSPMTSCETLMVGRAMFNVYIDESRPVLSVPEPSDLVAAAIVNDFKTCSTRFDPAVAEPGLFWVRGGYTREEILASKDVKSQLDRARNLQIGWFKALVSQADDEWGHYKMRRMISDLQRLAAKQLGLDREWDIDQETMNVIQVKECQFCRAQVHPNAIICMHCRGILDMEQYKKNYVAAPA